MQNNLVDNVAPIEPIQDTWEMRYDTATWYINLPIIFASLSTQEVNDWYANICLEILDSFASLARIWRVSFNSSAKSKIESVILNWELETQYDDYIQKVITNIKEFPDSIEELELKFDLLVFVRTKKFPNKPIRTWVRYLSDLTLCGGKEREKYAEPVMYLDMNHTLFCPSDIYGSDNTELYSLNHPVFENALRNWEKKIGKINEFDGIEGIYKYGFLPDEDD